MRITFQTINRHFNINKNKAQESQNQYQTQNLGATNPFAPLKKDMFEISFKASHCSTQNFQIKNKIENLRCPACGLIMLTDKQISNFATEIGACKGDKLVDALEKYEDESTLTGKPSKDDSGHGVYRPIKKQVVDVIKVLAKENPEMDLLQLTKLEAARCEQELIDKQMLVIEEVQEHIKSNFHEEEQKELLERVDSFIEQIKGNTEETFARKKFIYAMESMLKDENQKAELRKITTKMPTSENDVDSFFVKYSHKTKPQDVARGLVKQTIPTAEHLLPRSKNGGNRLSNYICDCADCNSRRGNIDFYDWLQALPGFEERLQLYIEDVQEAIDDRKLSPEYDTYIELIVDTIASLSEGELVLEIPEIKNPKKKEVVIAKRGREVDKVKSKNEALIQKRNALQEEIAALEQYPNFSEIDEHRDIIERIAQLNEQIQIESAKLIEARRPISILKDEIAALEAKKKMTRNANEKAEIKKEIDAKTQEYENLMCECNKKDTALGRLRRKQIKLKKQRKYYALKELAITKKLEELRVLLEKINTINERLSKIGNPSKKEEECRGLIAEIDTEIAQKQEQNMRISQTEGFKASNKADYEKYLHQKKLLDASIALLAGKSYKRTGQATPLVKELIEIAQAEIESSIAELISKDSVIYFINTNDIYNLEIKKEELLKKLDEYAETNEKISSLYQEIKTLTNGRTVSGIQREYSALFGEKRTIDEIHRISQKRQKLEELSKIIKKNTHCIARLEQYRTLSNSEWSELMSFIEVEDI